MAKYSRAQRDRAVDLYIRYGRSAADAIRELGYPSRGALWMWYKDRLEEERTGIPSRRGERYRRYSDEQKRRAVDHYLEYGKRPGRTMRMLGYPKSKELLMAWIDELAPGQRKLRRGPVSEGLRREAVVAVASGRLTSREAARELGVEPLTPTAASGSRDAAGLADAVAALGRRLAETRARLGELDADIERQQREKKELDIEIAIRKGALELLGKSRAQSRKSPADRELVKRTSEKLGVTARSLLDVVGIARSTYHYQIKAMDRPDKDAWLLPLVEEAFGNSERRYGYKRIHLELKSMGYQGIGETGHEAHDQAWPSAVAQEREAVQLVQGRVRKGAEEPGEPRLPRRESEHAVGHGPHGVLDPRGQVLPVADHRLLRRHAGRVDDRHEPERRAVANGMLLDACSMLKDGENPVIHSDRDCHYRWPEWIRICKDNNLTRSMSAKRCSPDNAAAEGFFGGMRVGSVHPGRWEERTRGEVLALVDGYIHRCNHGRIRQSFGWMSPVQYRLSHGLAA